MLSKFTCKTSLYSLRYLALARPCLLPTAFAIPQQQPMHLALATALSKAKDPETSLVPQGQGLPPVVSSAALQVLEALGTPDAVGPALAAVPVVAVQLVHLVAFVRFF